MEDKILPDHNCDKSQRSCFVMLSFVISSVSESEGCANAHQSFGMEKQTIKIPHIRLE
jgi:hypothetical protein